MVIKRTVQFWVRFVDDLAYVPVQVQETNTNSTKGLILAKTFSFATVDAKRESKNVMLKGATFLFSRDVSFHLQLWSNF